MLKKENRIRLKKEFAEVKKEGRILFSPLFGFLVAKKEDDLKKFAFIVSKKISKKAVDRNRVRRVLSEVIKNNLDRFDNGLRVVFLTKQAILGKGYKEVEKEVDKFLVSNDKCRKK